MAETHFQGGTNTRVKLANGGGGSNVTVSGLTTSDIVQVAQVIGTDLTITTYGTDTATISAANTVNVTGQTITSGEVLVLQYVDVP